jgi:hypothetical protein
MHRHLARVTREFQRGVDQTAASKSTGGKPNHRRT